MQSDAMTFLQDLSATERARDEQVRYSMRVEQEVQRILEESWDSADPYRTSRPVAAGLGSAANDLFHPSALGAHNARVGSRQHGDLPPFYRTEQDHWRIVDAARTLEALCPTAVNVLDVLSQFVIFTGFEYKIVPVKSVNGDVSEERDREGTDATPAPSPLVAKAQAFLDKWIKAVDWYAWQVEIFRRTRRDGEAFVILETDEITGMLSLRSVEPECVKEPQNTRRLNARLEIRPDSSWKYGVLTAKEDTATPAGYWVVSQYSDKQNEGTFYPAEEMFHLKTEWIDRQAKRGVSDFFSLANDIPGTKKLLRNLREGATVQAAIAWVREHPEQMTPGSGLGPNPPVNPTNVTRTGQRTPALQLDGPTMLDVSAGMKYTAGPLAGPGKSETLIKVLQAALRNIGNRWQFPEGAISGDASNADLASALVAEGPFVRSLATRQWWYRNAYKRLLERVLDHAAITGLLGPVTENILDEIEVAVECPPVAARKLLEETGRNRILYAAGALSLTTWCAREELDYDDEQANMATEPDQEFEDDSAGGDEPQGANPPAKSPDSERVS